MPKLQASGAFAQALDDNARALNGAYWKVYAAGTTTQATTYSNALLTIANAWPVIGDAAGRLPDIYVAPGNYRIRVETAGGVLIAESDNNVVYGLDPGEVAVAKFKTVAILQDDETMGYSLGGSVSVVVAAGDIVEAEGFRYSVLASGASGEDLTNGGTVKLQALPKNGVYVDTQFGVTGDGSAEQEKLRKALLRAAGAELLITKKVYVDALRETLPITSNTTVRFAPGAEIELLAHNETTYEIISIWRAENVTLIGPKVNGRRDLNSATTGEFGHGISIRGTTGKIVVIDPQTDNCWGDGIYLGSTAEQSWNDDVHIVRHKADNNRRQGMSIISVKKLIVDEPEWTNTNGTNPQYGCDIEPNENDEILEFIRINNPFTAGNANGGIGLAFQAWNGGAAKEVDILIAGHKDEGSGVAAFRVNGLRDDANAFGIVKSVDPVWQDPPNAAFLAETWHNGRVRVEVDRPTVIRPSTASTGSSNNSIYVFRPGTADFNHGGITIDRPHLILAGAAPVLRAVYAGDAMAAGATIRNVVIRDPEGDAFPVQPITQTYPSVRIETSLDNDLWSFAQNASTTIGSSAAYYTHNRAELSIYTLVTGDAAGTPVIVRNDGAGAIRVTPPSGGRFVNGTTGQHYQSAASAGHIIKVTPLGGGVWRVDALIGSWTLT